MDASPNFSVLLISSDLLNPCWSERLWKAVGSDGGQQEALSSNHRAQGLTP
jgi:hypothetical protein